MRRHLMALKYIRVENAPRKSGITSHAIIVYYCTWYRSVALLEAVLWSLPHARTVQV